MILRHIPRLQQCGHVLQRPHGGSSALLRRLFRQQSVDHGTHGVAARRAHLQQAVKHTQMDLLASLCVLCECAVDEGGDGGDGGWLGERRAQLVIQRAVLGHERVAVFLEEGDECLLQGEQRGRVGTPEELETAMAVLFDDRVGLGHGVLDAALEQLQGLLAVLGLVLQQQVQDRGKKTKCLHTHGFVVLLQCDEGCGAVEREVRERGAWLQEKNVEGVGEGAGEGRAKRGGERAENGWLGEERGRGGEEGVKGGESGQLEACGGVVQEGEEKGEGVWDALHRGGVSDDGPSEKAGGEGGRQGSLWVRSGEGGNGEGLGEGRKSGRRSSLLVGVVERLPLQEVGGTAGSPEGSVVRVARHVEKAEQLLSFLLDFSVRVLLCVACVVVLLFHHTLLLLFFHYIILLHHTLLLLHHTLLFFHHTLLLFHHTLLLLFRTLRTAATQRLGGLDVCAATRAAVIPAVLHVRVDRVLRDGLRWKRRLPFAVAVVEIGQSDGERGKEFEREFVEGERVGGLALLLEKGVLKGEECGAKGKQGMTTTEKGE